MSNFLEDPPSVTYRFLLDWVSPTAVYGQPDSTLEFATLRQNGFARWEVRSRHLVAGCRTTCEVEPLVRAWFLGQCIPGIVADFLDDHGDGAEWLIRLLRDDPAWAETTDIDKDVLNY